MKSQKILVIIQARLSSTRLPKKILLPVSEGQKITVLEYMLNRLQDVLKIPIIVAIPDTSTNNELADFLKTRDKIPIKL